VYHNRLTCFCSLTQAERVQAFAGGICEELGEELEDEHDHKQAAELGDEHEHKQAAELGDEHEHKQAAGAGTTQRVQATKKKRPTKYASRKPNGQSYRPLSRNSQRLGNQARKAARAAALPSAVAPGNSIVGCCILVTKTWYRCAELADIVSAAVYLRFSGVRACTVLVW
jgi:hypothetical protein